MSNPPVRRPKLGRPADADSAATRERIVNCAQEYFAANGFEATTNKQIAEAAGITTAGLYHYFPSKGEIYVAVCDHISQTIVSTFAKVCEHDPTLIGRVRLLVEEGSVLSRENRSALVFMSGMSTEVRSHPEIRAGIQKIQVEFRRLVSRIITTAEDTTGLLDGLSPKDFADFVSAVMGSLSRLNAGGQNDRRRAVGRTFIHLLTVPHRQ